MKLVMTLLDHGDEEMLEAQLAFHLNAGVDVVLVGVPDGLGGAEVLTSYERSGQVQVIRDHHGATRGELGTRLARAAATEHQADWVIPSQAAEFWWPRGPSLGDVLVAIPPRYTVVQALVRTFGRAPADAEFFAEARTLREAVDAPGGEDRSSRLQRLLRPVLRADPDVLVRDDGMVQPTRYVPLRAWYPIEVLRFPDESASTRDDDGLERPSRVVDTRLRDALRTLGRSPEHEPRFAPPNGGAISLVLPTPDVVDDASYAIECADVGEVDIASLEQQVDELEQRIAWLEQRFWPRVLRRLSRIVRPSGP